MALGKFGFKAATRALFKRNKEQTHVDGSLSTNCAKTSIVLIGQAKSNFNRQCRKTAAALHRRTKRTATTAEKTCTPEFIIPPIEFDESDLSILTEETFGALQHLVAVESPEADHTDRGNFAASSVQIRKVSSRISVAYLTVPSSTSASTASRTTDTDDFAEVSHTASSSTNTTLSVHAPSTSPPYQSENLAVVEMESTTCLLPQIISHPKTEPAPITSTAKLDTMVNQESKSQQQKMACVLQKLKDKLWPWNHATEDSSVKLDTVEETVEDAIEDCADRCQWDVIKQIEHTTVIDLMRAALTRYSYRYRGAPIDVLSTVEGSFHLVFKVKTFEPGTTDLEGWIVKVPGHGTPDRWTPEDEHMLHKEVETMRLIGDTTEIPIAYPIAYSATLDNEYGFPYIVMKELPGNSATQLWFEEVGEIPAPETEVKRLNFLRSLAGHMTALNTLQFAQIGIPYQVSVKHEDYYRYFDDPVGKRLPVDKYYVWPYWNTYDHEKRGPFASMQAYINKAWDQTEIPDSARGLAWEEMMTRGTQKILEIVLAHPIFHSTPTDTFTLRHSDLDTQNILIDDDGDVTGILDWDGTLAMPRCVGHAAVPHFLDRDWYKNGLLKTPFTFWKSSYYRDMYAAAMVEAGNPDAKYTTKSHIYQAVFAALYEGGDPVDIVDRLLRAIPGYQLEVDYVKWLAAKDCKVTLEMLKVELGKLLEPELPPEGFLVEVEKQHAEAAAQEWMNGFACFETSAANAE